MHSAYTQPTCANPAHMRHEKHSVLIFKGVWEPPQELNTHEVRTSDTYREVLAGGVRSEVGICQLKSRWNCAGSTHTGLQRRQLLADVCRFGEWSIGSSGRYRSALAKHYALLFVLPPFVGQGSRGGSFPAQRIMGIS